jgi:hypothetical protein
MAAINKLGVMESVVELVTAGLWKEAPQDNGFYILNYLEHQTSKLQVEEKREAVRERVKRYRNKPSTPTEFDDWDLDERSNAVSNALVTTPEYRTQNTEHRIQNTEVTTSNDSEFGFVNDGEESTNESFEGIEASKGDSSGLAITSLQSPICDPLTPIPYLTPTPRVKSASKAVERVSTRLAEARKNGVNAWNLSRLIEDEWDALHNANDIGGCIALTAWYVSELQSRELSSSDIARIGQMTKRFGRIALLAIDEAASKDLTDLVSYAFRVAQNLYKEKQGR